MLFEPTTLAATASAIVEAVQTYGCDPRALFRRADLDMDEILKPGARYPFSAMIRLWHEVRRATADPSIGLVIGQKVRPQALHALGFSWLASPTLLEGLRRIERYAEIVNSGLRLKLEETDGRATLTGSFPETALRPTDEAIDALLTVIIMICRLMTEPRFAPLVVTLRHTDNGQARSFSDYFRCPVKFSAAETALHFDLETLRKPVPAGNRELAYHNDQLAERYLATLNPQRVEGKVRELLLTLLPSGEASQQAVASSLHRSVSALQRQLKAEGLSYRTVLEQTRQALAAELVREGRYSLSQVAYLLGFSDQANFSRAFKRWTGDTPTAFRGKTPATAADNGLA